jgi:nitrate reductase gamma subunit
MDSPLVFLVAGVLPYVTAAVFLVGVIGTAIKWSQVRVPLRITLTPAPSSVVADLASEVLFFKTLFQGAQALWAGGWVFHVALALVLIGHLFGIGFLARQFMVLGVSAGQSEQLSATFGGAAGVVMMAAVVYLLYRRVSIREVRFISDPGDYLGLVLLLSIVLTGNYMRLFGHVGLDGIRDYVVSLALLKPAAPANGMFLVHFLFVQMLLIYFPFSKLMHSCGFFFTRWLMGRRGLVSPREVRP